MGARGADPLRGTKEVTGEQLEADSAAEPPPGQVVLQSPYDYKLWEHQKKIKIPYPGAPTC